ncbi:MAG: hypothetical protein ACFFCW_39285, partial [Candidatus Hodarchaeota archaeon]
MRSTLNNKILDSVSIRSSHRSGKIQLKIIDPRKDSRWDQFVYDHRYGSIYHHSAWMEVIKATYQYIPKYYILENARGEIQSAIPFFLIRSRFTGTRFVSLPFSPFCDPLIADADSSRILIDFVKKEVKRYGASFFEIKTFSNSKIFEKDELKKISRHKLHILPLENEIGRIADSFHKSCIQKSIRKA